MNAFLKRLLLLSMLFIASACDQNGKPIEQFGLDKLEKGISSESDVRMVMGQPASVWEEKEGTRFLEYPKGPEGARTWIFTIDQFGKLKDYRQVLTIENFARIKPGMTREQVRHSLGRPLSVNRYERKNQEMWDWRYLDGVTTRLFNVHFDMQTGQVVETSSSNTYEVN